MVTTLVSTITPGAKQTAKCKPLQRFACVRLKSVEWPDNAQEAWTQAPIKDDSLLRFVQGLDEGSYLSLPSYALPCSSQEGAYPCDGNLRSWERNGD